MQLNYTYYLRNYEESDDIESYDILSPEDEATYRAAVEAGEDLETAMADFLDRVKEGIIEQEKENFDDWGEERDDSYEVVLYNLEWKE